MADMIMKLDTLDEREEKRDKLQEKVDDLTKALRHVEAKEDHSFQKAKKSFDPIHMDSIKLVEDSLIVKSIRHELKRARKELHDYETIQYVPVLEECKRFIGLELDPNDVRRNQNHQKFRSIIKDMKTDLESRKRFCRKVFKEIGFTDYDDELLLVSTTNNDLNNDDDNDNDNDNDKLQGVVKRRRLEEENDDHLIRLLEENNDHLKGVVDKLQVVKQQRRLENDNVDWLVEMLNDPYVKLTQTEKVGYCHEIFYKLVYVKLTPKEKERYRHKMYYELLHGQSSEGPGPDSSSSSS